VTFESGDVVRVSFPFTDRTMRKRRPALVLSIRTFNDKHKHLVLSMITSAQNSPWLSDVAISDQASAGLPNPSVVRMKLFTLDERLVIGLLGRLSHTDKAAVYNAIAAVFGFGIAIR
jgi:mRNA interferase MazF